MVYATKELASLMARPFSFVLGAVQGDVDFGACDLAHYPQGWVLIRRCPG